MALWCSSAAYSFPLNHLIQKGFCTLLFQASHCRHAPNMQSNILIPTLLMKLDLQTFLPTHLQTILLTDKKARKRKPEYQCTGASVQKRHLQEHWVWEAEKAKARLKTTATHARFSSTSLVQLVSPPAVNLGPDAAVFNNKHDCCPLASIHFELLVAGRAVLV